VANTRSWIVLGPFQAQPSEVTKISVILVLARIFSEYREDRLSFKGFVISSVVVGLPATLTALQPDLGTALTYLPILIGTYILTGMRKKYLVILLVAVVLTGFVGWNYALKDYQKKRIETLLTPSQTQGGPAISCGSRKLPLAPED